WMTAREREKVPRLRCAAAIADVIEPPILRSGLSAQRTAAGARSDARAVIGRGLVRAVQRPLDSRHVAQQGAHAVQRTAEGETRLARLCISGKPGRRRSKRRRRFERPGLLGEGCEIRACERRRGRADARLDRPQTLRSLAYPAIRPPW